MIRMAQVGDVPEILQIYGHYVENSTATFEYSIPTREEFSARFARIAAQFPWLVWEEEGVLLGYVYASAPFEREAYSWCAELSVYLRPEAAGRGIGTRLYTAAEALLRLQGYRMVYALITTENEASIRFHRHMGYRVCGSMEGAGWKFGRWLGVTWMEKQLKIVEKVSEKPTSWLSIVDNDRKLKDILDKLPLS